ncbi:MAG: tetratricopeptide repeat protein [Bacteroidaceae bacterium]|nr:tetratricopeptide repeat protein [Bacteroidaceae bacterium]
MTKKVNSAEQNAGEMAAVAGKAWFETNAKKILGVLVAVLVLVGGYIYYTKYYMGPREDAAQAQNTLGLNYLAQGDYATALTGDADFLGFEKIASEYSGTKAANMANMYVGLCYAHQQQYAQAIEWLEKFDVQGDQSVSAMALYALANCYAAENQLDKAISAFKEAAAVAANEAISPMCLIEAGKLLESQGNNAEAANLYESIKKDYPTASVVRPSAQNANTFTSEIDKYIERASK